MKVQKIAILGSGNVATHLSLAMKSVGHAIVHIYSRSLENATILAQQVDAQPINELSQLQKDLDILIIAVPDSAIELVAKELTHCFTLVVHTSGSTNMNALNWVNNYGVLYPFQTFTKGKSINMNEVPFLVEANNEVNLEKIKDLSKTISSNVIITNSQQRMQLHIAAVFCCNFTNHMYHIAQQITKDNNLPFQLLYPLIAETANKITYLSPQEAQTGPAVRNDTQTIEAHKAALKESQWLDIYQLISTSISKSNNK